MASRLKHEDNDEEGSYQSPGQDQSADQSHDQAGDQPGSPSNQSKRRRFADEIDETRRDRSERNLNERDEPNHRNERETKSTIPPNIKGLPDHSDNFEMRFLIEAPLVGAIIGRQGTVIKKLRDDYGAFINILADPPGVPPARERVMIIRANPAALVATMSSCVGLWNERLSSSRNAEPVDPSTPPVSKLVALVHRVVVGAVIGKGGETIRNTMNDTGARIQVSGEVLPNSTEKSVTITGTQDQVAAALERIIKQLQTTSVKPGTPTLPYTPALISRYPAAYPMPGGPMGAPDMPPRGPPMPFGYGHPGHAQSMPPQPMPRYDDRRAAYDRAPMPVGPPFAQPMAPYHPGSSSRGFESDGPLSEQKIAIPSVCAGCVIGRGGEVIKALRAQSDCSIQVENAEANNPNERFVIIKGTQQNIGTAVRLITQCVESYRPPQ